MTFVWFIPNDGLSRHIVAILYLGHSSLMLLPPASPVMVTEENDCSVCVCVCRAGQGGVSSV